MNIISKVFNLACLPSKDEANYTIAYVAQITQRPQLFSSTQIADIEENEEQLKDKLDWPPDAKLIHTAQKFIKRQLTSKDLSSDLEKMYSILFDCLNERVARHIWIITKGSSEHLERVLKENYIGLLKRPEWDVQFSKRVDLPDHPDFSQFFKCQLKSDFLYRNNPHEFFMRMHNYLKMLRYQSGDKRDEKYNGMLTMMKMKFDEFVVRDLLVLYYYHDKKKGTEAMENYLMAKYNLMDYNAIPDNLNATSVHLEDADITSNPYYVEYVTSKIDLEKSYKFQYHYDFSCYKQAAEDWIHHRRNVSLDQLPEVVEAMYITLEQHLSSRRAYELFILSQYRMDMAKVKRMEAYLSEKYRPYFPRAILNKVFASYQNEEEPSFFQTAYPHIHECICRSNLSNPVYTKEMIDAVSNMLFIKKKQLPNSKSKKISTTVKHNHKLLNFLYKRPNQERVRELYAMVFYGIDKWEDAFYEKYKTDIKLLKHFEVVDQFSIW